MLKMLHTQLTIAVKNFRLVCKQLSRAKTDKHFWTKKEWNNRSILLVSFAQELMQTAASNDVWYMAFSAIISAHNDNMTHRNPDKVSNRIQTIQLGNIYPVLPGIGIRLHWYLYTTSVQSTPGLSPRVDISIKRRHNKYCTNRRALSVLMYDQLPLRTTTIFNFYNLNCC